MKTTVVPDSTPVAKSAILSPCGLYRYRLERRWGEGDAFNILMLNPSKADHETDDPTVTKIIGFARRWGYPGFVVTNLFAFRATKPADLHAAVKASYSGAVGPENDRHIAEAARECPLAICAWGANPTAGRSQVVLKMLRSLGVVPHAIKLTDKGQPWHPLMLGYDNAPFAWEAAR